MVFEECETSFSELSMKIAVTGATGFLGSHLVFHLAAAGYEVRALVRKSCPHQHPASTSVHQLPVDFNSIESITTALEGCEILIHLLGIINGSEAELRKSNVEITERVLQACRHAKIKKIVHMSSVAAVMGHGPYGRSKAEGEMRVRNSGIPHVIFQPAYIYGIGDRHLTKRMTGFVKYSPLVPVLGGGTFKIQPVFVGDVCQAILKAIPLNCARETFILAGPEQVSLKDMLQLMAKAMNVRRLFIPIPLRPMQALCGFLLKLIPNTRLPLKQVLELDKHQAFDIGHAREVLGFHPITFHEGVDKIFRGSACAA